MVTRQKCQNDAALQQNVINAELGAFHSFHGLITVQSKDNIALCAIFR